MQTLLSKPAKTALRIVGWVVSLLFLVVVLQSKEVEAYWGVALAGIGIISVHYSSKPQRRYYAPLVLSFLYVFGVLGSLTIALPNMANLEVAGYEGYGTFSWTNAELFNFMLAICAGMAGLFAGSLLMERAFKTLRPGVAGSPDRKRLVYLACAWLAASLAIILLQWHWGIGQVGLEGDVKLPVRLAGLLQYFKLIAVPGIGLYLLQVALSTGKTKYVHLVLTAFTCIGLVGSLVSLSRGYIVMSVGLGIAFIILTDFQMLGKRRIVFGYGLATLLFVLIAAFTVNEMRDIAYSDRTIKGLEAKDLWAMAEHYNIRDSITLGLNLASGRVGGARELAAVLSSGLNDPHLPLGYFFDDEQTQELTQVAVFGFLPNSSSDTAFGMSFSLFGILMLSGSFLMVFGGSMLQILFVMYVEEVFWRLNAPAMAFFFAGFLGMAVWSNMYWYIFWRDLVLIAVCLVAAIQMRRMIYRQNAKPAACK